MQQLYPSHEDQLSRLARIEGQIKGIRRMVEEQRYCIDIATQIKAVTSALRMVQLGVLEKHIHHCVKQAAQSDDPQEAATKINEIVKLVGKVE